MSQFLHADFGSLYICRGKVVPGSSDQTSPIVTGLTAYSSHS